MLLMCEDKQKHIIIITSVVIRVIQYIYKLQYLFKAENKFLRNIILMTGFNILIIDVTWDIIILFISYNLSGILDWLVTWENRNLKNQFIKSLFIPITIKTNKIMIFNKSAKLNNCLCLNHILQGGAVNRAILK